MKLFNIKVDKNLRILNKCKSLDAISSLIIQDLGEFFKKNSSDIVFVQVHVVSWILDCSRVGPFDRHPEKLSNSFIFQA